MKTKGGGNVSSKFLSCPYPNLGDPLKNIRPQGPTLDVAKQGSHLECIYGPCSYLIQVTGAIEHAGNHVDFVHFEDTSWRGDAVLRRCRCNEQSVEAVGREVSLKREEDEKGIYSQCNM